MSGFTYFEDYHQKTVSQVYVIIFFFLVIQWPWTSGLACPIFNLLPSLHENISISYTSPYLTKCIPLWRNNSLSFLRSNFSQRNHSLQEAKNLFPPREGWTKCQKEQYFLFPQTEKMTTGRDCRRKEMRLKNVEKLKKKKSGTFTASGHVIW